MTWHKSLYRQFKDTVSWAALVWVCGGGFLTSLLCLICTWKLALGVFCGWGVSVIIFLLWLIDQGSRGK